MNNMSIINVKAEGLSTTCAILCEGRLHDSLEAQMGRNQCDIIC